MKLWDNYLGKLALEIFEGINKLKIPDKITIPINRKTVWIFGPSLILWSLLIVAISDRFFRVKEIIIYPDGTKEYRVNP
jgi:hypothetical protein